MENLKHLKELLAKDKYVDERDIEEPGTNPMPGDERNNLQDVTKEK